MKLVFILFCISHYAACGWVFVSTIEDPDYTWWSFYDKKTFQDDSVSSRYLSALHWAVTTITTVGYGDIVPKTTDERIYTILTMIIGVTIFTFVVGSMSAFIQQRDHSAKAKKEKLDQVNQWLKYRQLPPNIQLRVQEFYNTMWSQKSSFFDESTLLKELPVSLRTSITFWLNEQILRNIPLFQKLDDIAITHLITKMQPFSCNQGDYLVRDGQEGNAMYIISRGEVDITTGDGRKLYRTLGSGDYFGEIALVNRSGRRTASAQAKSYCEMFVLSKMEFDHMFHSNIDLRRTIRTYCKVVELRFAPTNTGPNLPKYRAKQYLVLDMDTLGYKSDQGLEIRARPFQKTKDKKHAGNQGYAGQGPIFMKMQGKRRSLYEMAKQMRLAEKTMHWNA